MIPFLQTAGYAVLLVLLTHVGNLACKWVLRLSEIRPPPETGDRITLRGGRVIGVLERLLIVIG